MKRAVKPASWIIDNPEPLLDDAYRELTRLHRWIGDTRSVIQAIRRDPLPGHPVLDMAARKAAYSYEWIPAGPLANSVTALGAFRKRMNSARTKTDDPSA